MQARFLRLSERIGHVGLESRGEPHVKHLEGKLWELRLTGRDGIARALYVTAIGRRVVVVVRAFVKKTQRTPRAEVELALRRAKDIA
jgi:phage-related protein